MSSFANGVALKDKTCAARLWQPLLLAALFIAVCINPAASGWYSYNTSHGLPSNNVRRIFEDSKENLWIGTYDGGLVWYDGVSWRTYDLAEISSAVDTSAAYQNRVEDIFEDAAGNIWIATREYGVTRYDGVTWRAYTTDDGLVYNTMNCVYQDTHGNLWFGTLNGVSRFDGATWQSFTTAEGLPHGNVRDILEDSAGNMWFGTHEGAARYDGVSWRTFTTADGLVHNSVFSMVEDKNGSMWFTTLGGVSSFDGITWQSYTTADGLAGDQVYSIIEDRHGALWTGGQFGISRYDSAEWQKVTGHDITAELDVRVVSEDSRGNLWFGTWYSGMKRYDGVSWETFSSADGLGNDSVIEILEDSKGNLWFATSGGGVTRLDSLSWRTFTRFDGLGSNTTYSLCEDNGGNIWVATAGGATRFNGNDWTNYTVLDGLANNLVKDIFEDSTGNLWFGTIDGVTRYDGLTWRTYRTADGLVNNNVGCILEDTGGDMWFGTMGGLSRFSGWSWQNYTAADVLPNDNIAELILDRDWNLWAGTDGGVVRYDGLNWQTLTTADGLAGIHVYAILEDHFGNFWFGTLGSGVSRFDGENWGVYDPNDGLSAGYVRDVLEDSRGNLWFSCWEAGVVRHGPDLVSPQAVISPRPPSISTSTSQTLTLASGYREVEGIELSYSFDGSPWSEWSRSNSWLGTGLSDGHHVFQLRVRDKIGNLDPTPAVCTFEIDATPPSPVIASPTYGQAVRDSVVIRGTATDLRFATYRVEARSLEVASWTLLGESFTQVMDGVLAGWNTGSVPDGDYELRLSLEDTLGLVGTALVRVTVDNHEPWVNETTPAFVRAATGGHIYTTDGRVHLYFPPRAFSQDTEVRIAKLDEGLVPDSLAPGLYRVSEGYEITWTEAVLEKPATLEMWYSGTSYSGVGPAAGSHVSPTGRASASATSPSGSSVLQGIGENLALFFFGADSTWRRLGGTVDVPAERIHSPLNEPGWYSAFSGTGGATIPVSTLTTVSVTPRVFSPRGSFASQYVSIGFALARPGPVTVKVYNRAGRLVREIVSGEDMGAGTNLLRWNGRNTGGQVVEDGLYLVTVEALGEKQVKTLAVVR
ncbi:MAG: hypothetical protein JSW03_00245 [Candidatus Eiseniibacteriota bacterium]|nr:MAG: hypothetical protein JSW03_00245 [Candidatus Eisenbacteria bacterium]